MRTALSLAVLALACAATPASAEGAYLDIPISQSVNRDGAIRYAIWIKVGARSVQALLDTGSTGLRVLPVVVPGDIVGVPTSVVFGGSIQMDGLALPASIQIGSLTGRSLVEVVQRTRCTDERPDCGFGRWGGDDDLIGGDGFPAEGYSAIIGIGFPRGGSDVGNPLQALGVKRWIVDLPRPYDTAEGHLILEPDDKVSVGFTVLSHTGFADADGCIAGGPLSETKCGAILFDTGAPLMSVSYEGIQAPVSWGDQGAGTLSFTPAADTVEAQPLKLAFRVGENGGLNSVTTMPLRRTDPPKTFILAGVDPYLAYDVLYDSTKRAVGLRPRKPSKARVPDAEMLVSPTGGTRFHRQARR
jgi:hypothetical protein